MGHSSIKLTAIVIVLLAILFSGSTSAELSKVNSQGAPIYHITSSYESHAPIEISSNADFSTQADAEGWVGNGSESEPYIIENFNIASTELCVSISNTTHFFQLRSCLIESEYDGISFYNVTHSTISGCVIECSGWAVNLDYSSDCIFINNTVRGTCGFYLNSSHGCSMTNNTVEPDSGSVAYGIFLVSSSGCCVANNTMNGDGLLISGNDLLDWMHNVTDNTVNGRPLGYVVNATEMLLDGEEFGQLILVNSSRIVVGNGTFNQSSCAIEMAFCTNCTLTNTTSIHNYYHYVLTSSVGCTLANNSATGGHGYGFRIADSKNCVLGNNSVIDAFWYGFWVSGSANCTLISNQAIGNYYYGFGISNSAGCRLTNNSAISNGRNGFSLHSENCTAIENVATYNSEGFDVFGSDGSLIANCTANNNTDYGFHLESLGHCILSNDSAAYNSYGFYLSSTENYSLESCHANNNDFAGFGVYDSRNCSLERCDASENGEEGFYLGSSYNCTIANSVANENAYCGFFLFSSPTTRLLNDSAYNNRYEGFELDYSDNCILENNSAVSNPDGGFFIYSSVECDLLNNAAGRSGSASSAYGFFFDGCSDCTLSNNTLYGEGMYISGWDLSHWLHTVADNTVNGKSLGYFINADGLDLDGKEYGQLILANSSGVTIMNGLFNRSSCGIQLAYCADCNLINNTATENIYGFSLYATAGCTLINNTLLENGLFIDGTSLSDWLHNVTDNTVNGRPLGYVVNATEMLFDGREYGQLMLVNCSGIEINDGSFVRSSCGIELAYCAGCNLVNNTATENIYGFYLYSSTRCTITNNTALKSEYYGFRLYLSDHCMLTNDTASKSNSYGFQLSRSYNCALERNTATDNRYGGFWILRSDNCTLEKNIASANNFGFYILASNNLAVDGNSATDSMNGFYISGSQDSMFTRNAASANNEGFALYSADSCIFMNNTATGNLAYGFYVSYGSDGNLLFLNIIGTNGVSNAWDNGVNTEWDDGISLGNFWSDYSGTGVYPVPGGAGSIDMYPLIGGPYYLTIDSPDDVFFEEGSTGHSITWAASASHPSSYAIYKNDVLIESNPWDGSSIIVSLDSLVAGVYNYTLAVYDTSGNPKRDTVIVSVADSTPPDVDSPEDLVYEDGTLGHSITWSPSDLFPATYSILRNGSEIKTGSWDGGQITINAQESSLGVYNYTIVVFDQSANQASDTVIVTVVDTTDPSIDFPSDITYEEGATGNIITWNPSDLNPAYYVVYKNGTAEDTNTWGGASIQFTVDEQMGGFVYNYTLFVNDTSGNSAVSTIFVSVLLPESPEITSIQRSPLDVSYTDSAVISCQVTDIGSSVASVVLYYCVNDTFWHSLSMTPAEGGIYIVVIPQYLYGTTIDYYINATDSLGYWQIADDSGAYFHYMVDDFTPPEVANVLQRPGLPTYEDDVNITCDASDDGSGIAQVYLYYRLNGTEWIIVEMKDLLNGTFFGIIPKQPWSTAVEYYVNATDVEGNIAIKLYEGEPFQGGTVTDPVYPVIEEPIQDQDEPEPSSPVEVNCTITDVGSGIASAFIYYRVDGGPWSQIPMIWISGNLFSVTIPSQPWDSTVEYYVNVTDNADNTIIDDNSGFYYSYIVRDFTDPIVTITDPLDESEVVGEVFFNVSASDSGSGIDHVKFYIGVVLFFDDDTYPFSCVWDTRPYENGTYTLKAVAFDRAGNYQEDAISVQVDNFVDISGPTIDVSYNPGSPTHQDYVTVTATITDLSGVNTAVLTYSINNGLTWTNVTMSQSGSEWTATIPPSATATSVIMMVLAQDGAGNWGESIQMSYSVGDVDITGPMISTSRQPSSPTYEDEVNISASVYDVNGVAQVILSYSITQGSTWHNVTMTMGSTNWSASIPVQSSETTVMYRVYAEDSLGNWAATEVESYTVLSKTSLDVAKSYLRTGETLTEPRTLHFLGHDYDIYEYIDSEDVLVGVIIVNRTTTEVVTDEQAARLILLLDAVQQNWDLSAVKGVTSANEYWYSLAQYWEGRSKGAGGALFSLMFLEAFTAPMRPLSVVFDALSSITGVWEPAQYFQQFGTYVTEMSDGYSSVYGASPAVTFISTIYTKGMFVKDSYELFLSGTSAGLNLYGTAAREVAQGAVEGLAEGLILLAFLDDIDTAISDSFIHMLACHHLSITCQAMSTVYNKIIDGNAGLEDYLLLYSLQMDYYLIAKGLYEWRASVIDQYLHSDNLILGVLKMLNLINSDMIDSELEIAQSHLDMAKMIAGEWIALEDEADNILDLMTDRLSQQPLSIRNALSTYNGAGLSMIQFPILFLLPLCSVSSEASKPRRSLKSNKRLLLGVISTIAVVAAVVVLVVMMPGPPGAPLGGLPSEVNGFTAIEGPETPSLTVFDSRYFNAISFATYESDTGENVRAGLVDCLNESCAAVWLTCIGGFLAGCNASVIDEGSDVWNTVDFRVNEQPIRIAWKGDLVIVLAGSNSSAVDTVSEGIISLLGE